MDPIFARAFTLLPLTLLPLVLLLLAPVTGRRGRTRIAGLLAAGSGALLVLAILGAGSTATLTVVNPFMDPELGGPRVFELEEVTAPGWQWPVMAAAFLLLPALVILARRDRRPAAPNPALFCGALGVYWLIARLLLQKTAAPEGLVWAVGTSFAMLALMPFVGWFAAARGLGWGRWLGQLLVMGLIQRGALVVLALFLTLLSLGTHLDVSSIERANLPVTGSVDFEGSRLRAWFYLMVVPQLTLWIVITLVFGIVLGLVPYLARRRRETAPPPRPA